MIKQNRSYVFICACASLMAISLFGTIGIYRNDFPFTPKQIFRWNDASSTFLNPKENGKYSLLTTKAADQTSEPFLSRRSLFAKPNDANKDDPGPEISEQHVIEPNVPRSDNMQFPVCETISALECADFENCLWSEGSCRYKCGYHADEAENVACLNAAEEEAKEEEAARQIAKLQSELLTLADGLSAGCEFVSDEQSCILLQDCLWSVQDQECLKVPPSCIMYDARTCANVYHCFAPEGKDTCLPKCSIFDSQSKCGVQRHCSWSEDINVCEDRCEYHDNDACSNVPGCLASPKDNACVSKCKRLNNAGRCRRAEHCDWNGDKCLDRCALYSGVDECGMLQQYCDYNAGDSTCQFKCASFTKKIECNIQGHCAWDSGMCRYKSTVVPTLATLLAALGGPPPCKAFTKKPPCMKNSHCLWSLGQCEHNCGLVGFKGQCEDLENCIWAEDACVDAPPKCEVFEQKRTCDTKEQCSWLEGVCLANCDRFMTKTQCTGSDHCTWNGQLCAQKGSCSSVHKRSTCNQLDDCFWEGDRCFTQCHKFQKQMFCIRNGHCEWDDKDESCFNL